MDILEILNSSSFWNDSLAVSLLISLLILVLVLIYLMKLYHNVALNKFPGAYVERKPKPKKESELVKILTDVVPIEKEHEILMDHNYDGIKELDNNLPPWWKYGFVICIIWAVAYMTHYHILELGDLSAAEYKNEMIEADRARKEYLKNAGVIINDNNVEYLSDAVSLAKGESIFQANCKTCHGALGQGDAGPNLTDKYWKNGGSISEIFTMVHDGKGGMPAWSDRLSARDIQNVISFVHTLEGSNPPNAKEAEGELYEGE